MVVVEAGGREEGGDNNDGKERKKKKVMMIMEEEADGCSDGGRESRKNLNHKKWVAKEASKLSRDVESQRVRSGGRHESHTYPVSIAADLENPSSEKFTLGDPSVTRISTSPLGDAYDVVTRAKTALELQCPGIVSCADILAIAIRDLITMVGGPFYKTSPRR
ncbi:hypothetical protein H5410_025832 [Solanum commersonii]|uniref:peroxidase n=1 Tax=Solanum commersonii TaxID=4109 RepID=A0A9J5YZ21_SOLCO|nr:hypothetical protein H5410_025832 [Solanum commersonii]